MLGSDEDPTWREFPQALVDTRGARRYVTLFEAPFATSVLSDCKNNALQASSLMAVPPPPPETHLLAGVKMADLLRSSLTQWASQVQDVASGMRWPPEAAAKCPQKDIVMVLDKLEAMTSLKYCHFCFGLSHKCRCSRVPCQTPSQGLALWSPLTVSYAAMASSTETTASSFGGGVSPPRYPPPGLPPAGSVLMDPPPGPSTGNLLARASVGRGRKVPAAGLGTPTAPGLHQV